MKGSCGRHKGVGCARPKRTSSSGRLEPGTGDVFTFWRGREPGRSVACQCRERRGRATGQFAFGVEYLREPLGTLLMLVTLGLWVTSLGLLIGALAKGEEQVVIFSLIAMFLFAALGGAWFPLEIAGKPLPPQGT